MAELFKVKIIHSQSHLVFPKIVIGVLIILMVVMIIQAAMKAKRENKPFLKVNHKFFVDNYDKLKLWGSIVLFVLYILSLEILGFLIASIIFITLFNVLYLVTRNIKSLINSLIISVIASFTLWFLFGYVFNITLP